MKDLRIIEEVLCTPLCAFVIKVDHIALGVRAQLVIACFGCIASQAAEDSEQFRVE